MALGHCRVCDALVSLEPRGYKKGKREQRWLAVEHLVDGKRCVGSGRDVG